MKNISDYLNNKLSEQDSEALTKKLVQAKLDQDKRLKWQNALENQYQLKRTKAPKKNNRIISLHRWRNIAAVFLIVSIGLTVYFYQQNSVDNQLTSYLMDTKYTLKGPTVRGTDSHKTKLFDQAYQAYEEDRFEDARLGFEKFITENPNQSDAHFFLGLSHLYLGDYPKAIDQLQIARSHQDMFLKDSNWYLALAYLKNEQFDQAKKELKNIVDNQKWHADKAIKLLKRLD